MSTQFERCFPGVVLAEMLSNFSVPVLLGDLQTTTDNVCSLHVHVCIIMYVTFLIPCHGLHRLFLSLCGSYRKIKSFR